MIIAIAEIEGPVHIDVLTKRLTDAWGIRAGQRVVSTILNVVRITTSRNMIIFKDSFLWTKDTKIVVRKPRNGVGTRKIEHICEAEIQEAIRVCLISAISLSFKDLIKEVSNLFSLRVTSNVEWRVSRVISKLLKEKKIMVSNEKIKLNKKFI